jgi:hypothetical protein
MQSALHMTTKVLPGNKIEINVPELPEGTSVEVFLVLSKSPESQRHSALEFLDSLPAGPRSSRTWIEIEQYIQEERNSWER